MVVLTDDDFAELPLPTSHAIDVLEFVPAEQVDPILYAKAYYLEPDGAAAKPYVLLREALAHTDRVAIVKVALRQREQLATLRVRDNVLVLDTMLWPDEVRTPDFPFLDDDVDLRPAELAMAGSLIESMAADFEPKEYTDNYRSALQEVIAAKVAGREVVEAPEEDVPPTAAVDLMAALRASVDRARAARGEDSGEPAEPAPKRPRTKARATRVPDDDTGRRAADEPRPGRGRQTGRTATGREQAAGRTATGRKQPAKTATKATTKATNTATKTTAKTTATTTAKRTPAPRTPA
jgi:DNA end-binding protein Ku